MTKNLTFKFRTVLMAIVLTTAAFLQSCQNDDFQPIVANDEGILILNEGAFGAANASLSYYDRATGEVTNYVFKTKNGVDLGDQGQSIAIFEGKGYLTIQNDSKIEIINPEDFSSLGTIDALPSPRYFLGVSSTKAYVSDWGEDGATGSIKVIDLTTNRVIKTIPTGQGANKMLKVDQLVYVTNAGGWGRDNTIKVIEATTDEVTGTIIVGDNPNSIVRDADGNIWVTSSGHTAYNSDWNIDEENSTKPSLSKITSGNAETFRLEGNESSYASMGNLSISPDGRSIYYTYNGGVYKMSTAATSLPTTPFINKSYYSLAIDPATGNILAGEAPNFSSAGNLDIISSTTGQTLETFKVGIAPISYAFN